jgi:hypothetical protein
MTSKYTLNPETGLPVLENPQRFWRVSEINDYSFGSWYRQRPITFNLEEQKTYAVSIVENVWFPPVEAVYKEKPGQWLWSDPITELVSPAIEGRFEVFRIFGEALVKKYHTRAEFLEDFTEDQWKKLEDSHYAWSNGFELDEWLEEDYNWLYRVLPLTGENILLTAELVLENLAQKEARDREREEKRKLEKAQESQFLGDYPPKGIKNV